MAGLNMQVIMWVYKIHDEEVADGWREPCVAEDMDSNDIYVNWENIGEKGRACVALRRSKEPVVVGVHKAQFRHLTVLVNPFTGEVGIFNHNRYSMFEQHGDIYLQLKKRTEEKKRVYSGKEKIFYYSSRNWLRRPSAKTSSGNKSPGIEWGKSTYLAQVVIPLHQLFGVMYYGNKGLDGIEEQGCVRVHNHRNGDHQDNRLVNIEPILHHEHVDHDNFLEDIRAIKQLCVLLLMLEYYGD